MLLPFLSFGQNYFDYVKENKKAYIFKSSFSFTGGAINGVNQDLQYHYSEFKRIFPNANNQFWDPSISWGNKYNYKYKGFQTWLVWTTDGKHATDTGKMLFYTAAIVTPIGKRPKKIYYLYDFILLSAVRSAGFHLTYSIIIK